MGKETVSVRPGQENDDKTQTENVVSSSVMKALEHSELEEDGEGGLASLSVDDIISHIEKLKIKDETTEIYTARGKVVKPARKVDERVYPYQMSLCPYGQSQSGPVQHSVPEYMYKLMPPWSPILLPYDVRGNSVPQSYKPKQPNRLVDERNYVEGVDERCRIWTKTNKQFQQQCHQVFFPRRDVEHGEWQTDGRARKSAIAEGLRNRKVASGRVQKIIQRSEDVADGIVLTDQEDDLCFDELDGFDLERDCCPDPTHFAEKAWEQGIPKLDLPAQDLMEIFENSPDSHILLKDHDHFYSPISPMRTISNYHPSPDRIDEVLYNQDSNDRLSSPEHSQDECEIIDDSNHYTPSHGGLSPEYGDIDMSDMVVSSPTPEDLKRLEQINDHLNDQMTTLDSQIYCDWISCDIDGDSVLHSCMIAQNNAQFVLLLVSTLASEGILSSIIDLQNQMLRTALFLAALEGNVGVVRCLLEHNADPNIQGKVLGINDNYELRSPLHIVAERGDNSLEVLRILLNCDKTNVDLRSESDRRTALHLAMLSHCVDKSERSKVNCSQTVQLLIQYNADVEMPEDCSSKTPIILAIDTRDYELVKTFITSVEEHDKDLIRSILEMCTRAGDTPLHIAAGANILKDDKVRLIRLLVNRGANTHTENNIKQLPEDISSRDLWKAAFNFKN